MARVGSIGTQAVATALTAALLASSTIAGAQPASAPTSPNGAPTDKQKQQAGDLVKRAIAKAQAGGFTDAIDLYLQAYAILPEPVLLSNVGAAYQQENKPVEALSYFCRYLDVDPDGNNAAYALAQAKQLQSQIGNNVDDKTVCAKPKAKPDHPAVDTTQAPGTTPTTTTTQATDKPATGTQAGATASDDHTFEYVGLGIAGVGVLGLVVGLVYGDKAQNLSNEITKQPMGMPWPSNIKRSKPTGRAIRTSRSAFSSAAARWSASARSCSC